MYKRILVPLDGSSTSERGLSEAIRFARGHDTRLVLLHVIDDFPTMREFASNEPIDSSRVRRQREAEDLLRRSVRQAEDSGIDAESSVRFAIESAPDTIVETAAKLHCELIVIGTHGRSGFRRAVLGSVAERVSRHSPVPVMLVPPEIAGEPGASA